MKKPFALPDVLFLILLSGCGLHSEPAVPVESNADMGSTPASGTQLEELKDEHRISIHRDTAPSFSILFALLKSRGDNFIVYDDFVPGTASVDVNDKPSGLVYFPFLKLNHLSANTVLGITRVGNAELFANEAKRASAHEIHARIEDRYYRLCGPRANEVLPIARTLLSPRGSIFVDERSNALIVRDELSQLREIEALIDSLETSTELSSTPKSIQWTATADEKISAADFLNSRASNRRPNSPFVTVELEHEPVADAVKAILAQAKVESVNIFGYLSGRVSLSLKRVPLEDALQALLFPFGLSFDYFSNALSQKTAMTSSSPSRVDSVGIIGAEDQLQRLHCVLDSYCCGQMTENVSGAVIKFQYADPVKVLPLVQSYLTPRGSAFAMPSKKQIVVRDVLEGISEVKALRARIDRSPRELARGCSSREQ
ncbi:MAG: secretin N-terminal domain-containing protein [Bdellovibrionota bacterium]